MARNARRSTRGATLIETLTATALMATILGIGIPQIVRLRSPYTLRSATHQVAADVQAARMRAIARNTRYRVHFDTTAHSYTLERETTPNVFVADATTQYLPHGTTFSAPSPSDPTFDTRGLLATDVGIQMSTGSSTRTLTINVLGKTTIS